MCRVRPHAGHLEDRLDRDALPVGVELRPTRHAVDVGVDRLAWQLLELRPGQRARRVDLAPDLEVPRREIRMRYGPVVEDRELVGLVLTWRDPFGHRRVLFLGAEESFEHGGP